jgi:predicted MFS family arabinose efflux permease
VPTISFLAVAVFCLALLYFVETRVRSPVIDFKLFGRRGFISGSLANFTLVASAYSAFFLMPLYLGNIIRKEAFEIGLLLLPITVLIVIVAPVAGRVVDARGAKLPIVAGLACLALSASIQSTYTAGSSICWIVFGFIFMGLGWGAIFGSGAFAAISSLPKDLAGTAAGALWTLQNLGGSLGLAIAGVIFRDREKLSRQRISGRRHRAHAGAEGPRTHDAVGPRERAPYPEPVHGLNGRAHSPDIRERLHERLLGRFHIPPLSERRGICPDCPRYEGH